MVGFSFNDMQEILAQQVTHEEKYEIPMQLASYFVTLDGHVKMGSSRGLVWHIYSSVDLTRGHDCWNLVPLILLRRDYH